MEEDLSVSAIKQMLFNKISQQQFNELFANQQCIGQGNQGKVYKAFNKDKQLIAIKQFKKQSLTAYRIPYVKNQILNLSYLSQLKNEGILNFINSYRVSISDSFQKYYIVTEHCQSDLSQYHVLQLLPTLKKLKICESIVSAIKVAHQNQIIHRDLKPQNILIKSIDRMNVKIADFGCCRSTRDYLEMTPNIGTPLYADPNVQTQYYTEKCDIYSIGLIIHFIFCGKNYFSDCLTIQALKEAQQTLSRNIQGQIQYFLSQINDLDEKIKVFLIEIALFTLNPDEGSRKDAQNLLEFIQNEIQNYQYEHSFNNQNQSQARFQSINPQIISSIGENQKKQRVKLWTTNINQSSSKLKDQAQDKGNQLITDKFDNQTNKYSEKSKQTLTSENYQLQQKISSEPQSIKTESNSDCEVLFNENYDESLTMQKQVNLSVNKTQVLQSKIGLLKKQEKQIQKQLPVKNNQNYVQAKISQNNDFESNKAAKNANKKIKESMFGNLKTYSQIIEQKSGIKVSSKVNQFKSQQDLRKKNIDESEKRLNQVEKLSSELIKGQVELSKRGQQCEAMRKILNHFNKNKVQFQKIKEITKISGALTKQQKQCIAFLFHYYYAGKLDDFTRFSIGQKSNISKKIGIESNEISADMRQYINKCIDSQRERKNSQMIRYARDLGRKMNLIRPKLSDQIKNMINCIRLSQNNPSIKQNEDIIKSQIRSLLDQKLQILRLDQDKLVIKMIADSLRKIL